MAGHGAAEPCFQPSHFPSILGRVLNIYHGQVEVVLSLKRLKQLFLRAVKVVFEFGFILLVMAGAAYVLGQIWLKIAPELPIFYESFLTNAQAIVGAAELIVAATLCLTAAVEVLSFLLRGDKNTTTTLTRKY
jgi:hypothetical protein